MSNIIKEQKTHIADAGTHNAVCYAAWDIGVQPGFQGGPAKNKHVLAFEVEQRVEDKGSDYNGKRITITCILTDSLNKRSNMGKLLVSWRGKDFTKDEKDGFDIDSMVGQNATLTISNIDKEGTLRHKIEMVAKPMKKAEVLKPEAETKMPDWVKKMKDGDEDLPF